MGDSINVNTERNMAAVRDDSVPAISQQIRDMEMKLNFLGDQIIGLADRLGPIMVPTVVTRPAADGGTKETPSSEVTAILRGFNERLDGLAYRVGVIHEQLEL